MKTNLIFLVSALCAGGLCGIARAENAPSMPPRPECNADAFSQKCVLLPLKHQERCRGWNTDGAMQAFCKSFKPEEKGIHLNYKGNTLRFIVTYPEITEGSGFNVYVVNLLPKTAMKMEQELKKNDIFNAGTPVPTVFISKVVSGHLIVIHGKSQERSIIRGLLDNMPKFMGFE